MDPFLLFLIIIHIIGIFIFLSYKYMDIGKITLLDIVVGLLFGFLYATGCLLILSVLLLLKIILIIDEIKVLVVK